MPLIAPDLRLQCKGCKQERAEFIHRSKYTHALRAESYAHDT